MTQIVAFWRRLLSRGKFFHRSVTVEQQTSLSIDGTRSVTAKLIAWAPSLRKYGFAKGPLEHVMLTRTGSVAALAVVFFTTLLVSCSARALPASNMLRSGLTADTQQAAAECPRDRCLRPYPSYYDTPPELRPRIFYGYEPHKQGDWYRHYKNWFGYDFFGYRRSWR